MSFEVKQEDLAGRIGKLRFKGGSLETPALLPVVNPKTLEFPPRRLWELGYGGLTTNAYLIWKNFGVEAVGEGVHRLLGFQGFVLTDSGAYQLLQYGEVEVDPLEIAEYQCRLQPDMAVILDVPTGWNASRRRAEWTVEETMRRAELTLSYLREKHPESRVLWVGPIQGGKYLDLVSAAARRMAKLDFDAYALGSPTGVMEAYHFSLLAEMILTAKAEIPPNKPFHLFGAGHPLTFALAVALGCDTFDSASYALYAKDGRYITEHGTVKLERLRHLACNCPACRRVTLEELAKAPRQEVEAFLMEHNLYACLAEVEQIKQSIAEGRLWEHLEIRARSHPALHQALKILAKHWEALERTTPRWKPRGLFIFDEISLGRPEVQRHRARMLEGGFKLPGRKILLLLPEPEVKPYVQAQGCLKVLSMVSQLGLGEAIQICFYNPVFGVTPVEICDVYPLSQFEVSKPYSKNMLEDMAEYLAKYVEKSGFETVILHPDPSLLTLEQAARLKVKLTGWEEPWSDRGLENLRRTLAGLGASEATLP